MSSSQQWLTDDQVASLHTAVHTSLVAYSGFYATFAPSQQAEIVQHILALLCDTAAQQPAVSLLEILETIVPSSPVSATPIAPTRQVSVIALCPQLHQIIFTTLSPWIAENPTLGLATLQRMQTVINQTMTLACTNAPVPIHTPPDQTDQTDHTCENGNKHQYIHRELERRDNILKTVAFAAEQFLRTNSMRQHITIFLEQLGTAAEVSRVYVFENHTNVANQLVMTQRYAWVAPNMTSQVDTGHLHNLVYQDAGLSRWVDLLGNGNPLHGDIHTFPDHEQVVLQSQGIYSIAIIPIFVGDIWWGFIGFDETRHKRLWSEAEIDAIRTAASIIGTAIQRDRVQTTLNKNEEELRTLYRAIEQSPNSIIITNTEGIIEYVNPRFTEVTGYTFTEAVGNTPRILKSGCTAQEEYQEMWAMITAGKEWRGTFCNRKKNGQLYWDSVSISPITNAHEHITHFVAVKEDISERVRAEENLRYSEQKFRGIIEQSYDGIVLNDEDGNISEWNIGAENITGFKRSQVVGRPGWEVLFHLLPHDQRTHESMEIFQRQVEKFTRTGEATWVNRLLEYPFENTRGEQRYVQQMSFPIKTNNGFMISSIIRDITERKQVEAEIRKAREIAEATNRAKSEFLANMSHEIRTPLNAIIGMNNLLLTTDLTPRQQDFVQTALTSSDGLLSLINDILDFSKMEAGKLTLKYEPFNLRACIEEPLDMLANKAAEKQIDLAYIIDDEIPPLIIGDVDRLRQILINILSNAVKFTEHGEVVVTAKLVPSVEQSSQIKLHVQVHDTGIGISQEGITKLFQSFSQVDTSNTRKYSGTGLGLAISKRLAEMMGGTMWVESAEGKGSTFHITFLAQVAEDALRMSHELSKATLIWKETPAPILVDKHILIVSDATTSRTLLTRYTQLWGMISKVTLSQEEALDRLQQGYTFDAIILDIHATEQEGLELAAKIQTMTAGKPIPLVLVISVRMWYEVTRNKQIAIAASTTRPIKPAQLYEALVAVFTQQPVETKRIITRTQGDYELGKHRPLAILLAEDTSASRKMFLYSLETMGYAADVAKDGKEVVHKVQHGAYDVVLMDVQMPELDGLEATKRIRTLLPHHRQPWIIALTASAMDGDRERCLNAGMNDYVSKPVKIDELVNALLHVPDKYIGKSVGGQPLPDQHDQHNQHWLELGKGQEPPTVLPADPAVAAPLVVPTPNPRYSALPTTEKEPSNTQPAQPARVEEGTVQQDKPTESTEVEDTPLHPDRTGHFLATIMRGGVELACDFIANFLHDIEERVYSLEKNYTQGNAKEFHRAAHSLKSLSGQVGAMRLSHMSEVLERMGLDLPTHGVQEHIDQITTEFVLVKDALYKKMEGLS